MQIFHLSGECVHNSQFVIPMLCGRTLTEVLEIYMPPKYHLSGETRKVETDRVAVGTFSGEGLSPVFQERAPWSIMDETNKAREHKKA